MAGADGATGPTSRPGTGRAVAVLVLVALGALIPLLGPSAALHGTGEAAAPGVGGIALLRAVLFAALCVPVGELFVNRLARSVPGAPPAAPRSWAPYAAAVGLVAALGLASVVATGNLVPHSLAEIDVGGLYESRDGKLALVEVNAFLAAALCARSARPGSQVWPLAAVVAAEALRAHPTTEYSPWVGSGLTLVHLTCAALWVGGLLHVLRTLRGWGAGRVSGAGVARGGPVAGAGTERAGPAAGTEPDPGAAGAERGEARAEAEATGGAAGTEVGAARGVPGGTTADGGLRPVAAPAQASAALLGLYARVAAVLLAVITATGVWSTLRRMPQETVLDQLTSTAYGRVLLAKVLLVAAVAVLALWARIRLRRAPDPLTACSPARAEVVALGVVVVVSGLLTALPVPIRW
ncbi:CopD family protein [Streptomyces sp. S.PB5]|uniref:CopD family protein n=1 Tax=Streptomyces sp. S.PB5 TaxID=3020844 RepID=UPI0025B0142F|nr:CopD family protein [Streptomyces sp. S.PB5]MDN3021201.1 CopD family protein [Streptomyces sp. S.PB5]